MLAANDILELGHCRGIYEPTRSSQLKNLSMEGIIKFHSYEEI